MNVLIVAGLTLCVRVDTTTEITDTTREAANGTTRFRWGSHSNSDRLGIVHDGWGMGCQVLVSGIPIFWVQEWDRNIRHASM